jgi:NAD-dependent DNA ligase
MNDDSGHIVSPPLKIEHQREYKDLILDRIQDRPTPNIVKIRVTKKKRPLSKDEIMDTPSMERQETITNAVKGRLNEKLIAVMDELAGFMMKRGEPFKARAYQKAQETLILYPKEITDENYPTLEKLPGVGETITKKIDEYVKTGTLRILERERADPQHIFSEIYGIGPKKADELVKSGVKTVAELREKQDTLLNDVQKKGLKYYEDILLRIPRSEIDDYDEIFKTAFEKVKEDGAKYEIVGSYRRGAKTSGDIDVIITSENKGIFKEFMDQLLDQGIIVELLSRGPTKSLVVAKLPNATHARRVDFLYSSPQEYPFAVLYFTGSKFFNTAMRGRALSKGYSLNEHGMYAMDGKKKGDKITHEFPDERSIFAFLNMEYKEPDQRVDGRSVTNGSQENITMEIQETVPVKKIQTTRKNRDEKKDKQTEKDAMKQEKKDEKDAMKQEKKDEKDAMKQEKKDEKERVKREEKERKEAAKKAEKEEKEAVKQMLKKEKEASKTAKKREKEDAKQKTLKLRQEAKKENIIKTKNETIKKRTVSKKMQSSSVKKTLEPPKIQDIQHCPVCKITPVDLDSSDPILHAIQHFKTGGTGILEQLNEKTLNNMLVKTNDVYRNLGPNETPLITDNQYDILEDFIKQKYPKNSVVGKIGAPVSKNKATLPYEMWSMDKIKPDTKALVSWKAKYKGPYVLSCKLDGVSGLYTTEGSVPKLYTRGDGKVGQDVTHLIPYLHLPTEKGIVVRGEFIMRKSVFESKYKDIFANARNLVAGTVNRVTINDTVQDVDFVAYEVVLPSLKPGEQMKKLEESGFNTVRNETHKDISNDMLSKMLVNWRENYEYEIDGVIVTDDNIHPRKTGNPDHSFAFKMVLSDQMAETKVLDVEWNASKDGYLKPRVKMEPVHLNGVKIEYATGFNGAFIEQNRIGVGALIQLIRSGDVIPYIKSVITPAEEGLMPTVPYIWNEKHVDIMLENKDENKTVLEKNIAGFFKGIEVDGLGDGNISKLVDAGFDSIPKILKMSKNDFLTIDGFKEKMADKLHKGIAEKAKTASLVTVMSASNLLGRGFGDRKNALIMEEYPHILTSTDNADVKTKKLSEIKGMASKTAKSFVENIPKFLGFLEECGLLSKISHKTSHSIQIDDSHPLYKKSIVMSGTRDKDLEKALSNVGALMGSSVSSKTFAVITPDVDSNTGKVASAKKQGVPVFTPASFKTKYGV